MFEDGGHRPKLVGRRGGVKRPPKRIQTVASRLQALHMPIHKHSKTLYYNIILLLLYYNIILLCCYYFIIYMLLLYCYYIIIFVWPYVALMVPLTCVLANLTHADATGRAK